jgi:hypothetical protein
VFLAPLASEPEAQVSTQNSRQPEPGTIIEMIMMRRRRTRGGEGGGGENDKRIIIIRRRRMIKELYAFISAHHDIFQDALLSILILLFIAD